MNMNDYMIIDDLLSAFLAKIESKFYDYKFCNDGTLFIEVGSTHFKLTLEQKKEGLFS